MSLEWTPTYTAIMAAIISSSLLTIFTEPILNKIKVRKIFKGWQAVFLPDNQIYFGKIIDMSRYDVTLIDIFYLNPGYPSEAIGRKMFIDETLINTGELMKLGCEIHAPKDAMIVNRSHILFMENLNDNGPVVEAINQYLADKKPKESAADTTKLSVTDDQ